MSLGGEDVKKTEELPGAFPSEATTPLATPSSSTTQGLGSQNNNGDSVLGNAAGAAAGRGSSSAQQKQPGSLGASTANPLSGPAVAHGDGFGPDNAPDITEDLKAVGSGAATAATAAAIAAKDAAVAVKDAAAPVVSAASEQVGRPLAYFYRVRLMADL